MQTYSPRITYVSTPQGTTGTLSINRDPRGTPRPRASRQKRNLPNLQFLSSGVSRPSDPGVLNTINRLRNTGSTRESLPSTTESRLSINRGSDVAGEAGEYMRGTAQTSPSSGLTINRGDNVAGEAGEYMRVAAQTAQTDGPELPSDSEELPVQNESPTPKESNTSYLPWLVGGVGVLAVIATTVYVSKSNRQ